jgi:ATP-dependent DNA helicase RecG
VDELGSGVRNIYKYSKIYSGADPTLEILKFCKIAKTRSEIQDFLRIKSRRYLSLEILAPLVKGDLLKMTIPDKPTSPKQKYYSERH